MQLVNGRHALSTRRTLPNAIILPMNELIEVKMSFGIHFLFLRM